MLKNLISGVAVARSLQVLAGALTAITLPFVAHAQAITSGVTFQWDGPQPNATSPANLESVTVDGVVFDDLVFPDGYQLVQVAPGGDSTNSIRLNGTDIETNSSSATWNSSALSAFQSPNLNFKFEADAANANANICNDPSAIPSTSNQIQRLTYSAGVSVDAESLIGVTERNANNCLFMQVRGIPAGGGAEIVLGGAFSNGGPTIFGATFAPPSGASDYWGSGRVNSNNGTIGVALFRLSDIVPAGSVVTGIDFIAATRDHGDGKVFLIRSTRTADLAITKTNTPGINGEVDQSGDNVISGTNTTYSIVVTNNGPDDVTGALVTDTPTAGLTCLASSSVTITGDGVPSSSFTIGDLTGAGIALGTLASGDAATLTFECEVN